ncbi:MAG: hypothetical protein ACK449_01295, partial [Planctomycetota bacterium]
MVDDSPTNNHQSARSPNGAQGDSPGQHRIPRTRFDAISHAPKRTQGGASLYPGLSHVAPLGHKKRCWVVRDRTMIQYNVDENVRSAIP